MVLHFLEKKTNGSVRPRHKGFSICYYNKLQRKFLERNGDFLPRFCKNFCLCPENHGAPLQSCGKRLQSTKKSHILKGVLGPCGPLFDFPEKAGRRRPVSAF